MKGLFKVLTRGNFIIQENKIIQKDFVVKTEKKKDAFYTTNLSVEINLEKIGLLNLNKITEVVNCKQNLSCITNLIKNTHRVEIEEIEEKTYWKYKLISYKKFLIENEFKNLEIVFLIPHEESKTSSEQELSQNPPDPQEP